MPAVTMEPLSKAKNFLEIHVANCSLKCARKNERLPHGNIINLLNELMV